MTRTFEVGAKALVLLVMLGFAVTSAKPALWVMLASASLLVMAIEDARSPRARRIMALLLAFVAYYSGHVYWGLP